ncbi:trace amine-associated receptor 4-like [Erpetoichthys calabaricus]|uniref:trace amine-associated receptor 4-like n=1 Tax=Erpetoichthys calabaricus TaxID=27687 RepID=UPI002233F466|nr:trace amine-associated receptor 4-like [Erpetoichthys calabaricus]
MNFSKTKNSQESQYCFEHINGSCSRSLRPALINGAMYIFMSATILITLCGNLIVIFVISLFRQLHSPTNFLILSLACVDFLLGAVVMPYSMVRSVEACWYFGELFCKIHSSTEIMMPIASVFHLCFISIDRYYAVCDPLRYKTKITTSVVALFIACSWLYAMCFAFGVVFLNVRVAGIEDYILLNACVGNCGLIFNKQSGVLVAVFGNVIPGAIMMLLYVKIFSVAKKQVRLLNKIPCNSKKQKSQESENKAAKTLAIVMGVFLICWSPFMTVIVIDPFVGFTTPHVLFDALGWLVYFNSTFNPVIYGLFFPWFRKALKIILRGKLFT